MDKFKVSVKLNCSAKEVFTGWLDNQLHADYTGGQKADISKNEGGNFSVWNGYITGKNIELFPHKRIVQSWRTSDFSSEDPDSQIEISFQQKEDHVLMSISHSKLPAGSAETYKKGWKSFYFKHMKLKYA